MSIKTSIITVLTTTLLFGAYVSPARAERPERTLTKTIKVKVDNPGDPASANLEITAKKTGWGCSNSSNPGKGCVKVDKGEAADLVFDMTGKPKCSGSDYWVLTAVQLGGYNSADKPDAAGWGNLPDDVVADFRADKTTGEAQVTLLDRERIRVHNMNQAEYDIWYRLKATCDHHVIYSDPRIKNTGK